MGGTVPGQQQEGTETRTATGVPGLRQQHEGTRIGTGTWGNMAQGRDNGQQHWDQDRRIPGSGQGYGRLGLGQGQRDRGYQDQDRDKRGLGTGQGHVRTRIGTWGLPGPRRDMGGPHLGQGYGSIRTRRGTRDVGWGWTTDEGHEAIGTQGYRHMYV